MYKEIAALAEKKKAAEAAESAASKKLNTNTTRNITNQFSTARFASTTRKARARTSILRLSSMA